MLRWNDYFKLRSSRNKIRPLFGIPSFFFGVGYVVKTVEFNPTEPILGVDPAFIYGFASLTAGAAAYQIGAASGQIIWRIFHRSNISTIDKMDKMFYNKIKTYRAERGQSPYVQSTGNLLKMKNNDLTMKQDFYGERIKNVSDYRQWLKRQRKLVKEQLGPDAPLIRGA